MTAGFQRFPVVNMGIPERFDKARGGLVIDGKHHVVIGVRVFKFMDHLLFAWALRLQRFQINKAMPSPQQQPAGVLIVVKVVANILRDPLLIFCFAGQVA